MVDVMFVSKQSNLKRIRKNSLFILVIVFLLLLGATTVSGSPNSIANISPPSQTVSPGETFSVDVYCTPGQPIKSFEFKLSFDESRLQVNSVTKGDIFDGHQTIFNSGKIDNVNGSITDVYGLILGPGNVSSPGTLVTISFTAKTSAGTSLLHLYDLGVTNETEYVPITTDDGGVTVYNPDTSLVFSEVTPEEGSTYVSVGTSSLSVKIENPDGDPFDWVVSTSPNIGSSFGNGAANGTKSCVVSGLSYYTTYTWYVNCKNIVSGEWTNESYWFKTEEEPQQGGPPPGGGGAITPPPITEKNNPPNQPITPSGPTLVERDVVYEYSSYTYDVDGDQVKLMFDWGDGNYSDWSSFVASNTTVSMSHSWDAVSNYTIKVMAQDEKGLNSTWSEPLVVIISETGSAGEPPHMEIKTPDKMVSNETMFFDASGSYDLNGVIVSYQWDFGDGETGTGMNATHNYKTPGYYTATLVVTDNDGNTYNTSIGVNVLSEVTEGNLQQERGEPFPIFTIISVCVFIIIISLIVVFRDRISLFLLDKRLRLLKNETSDEKNKLYKSVGRKKRIDYYSTVTNPTFSVKKKESSRDTPEKLHDYHLKKEKIFYDPLEIVEEEKRLSEYDEFIVGDKVDKLVKTNLKPDRVDDILEDIRREIGGFRDVGDDADGLDIEKKVDDIIRSKTKNEINEI